MKIYSFDRRAVIKDLKDTGVLEGRTEAQRLVFYPSRYEFFVIQLVVFSRFREKGVAVSVNPLLSEKGVLQDAAVCFNTAGKSPNGKAVIKSLDIEPYRLKPVFIGFDLLKAEPSQYKTAVNIGGKSVEIVLNVTDEPVFDCGADTPENLTRLKWLLSDTALDGKTAPPFEPITIEKNEIGFTGKKVKINHEGLIENSLSYFDESNTIGAGVTPLFYRPMEIDVAGQKFKYSKLKITGGNRAAAIFAEGKSEALKAETRAEISYEGLFDHTVRLTAERDIILENLALNIYFSASSLNSGLGKAGGAFDNIRYKWQEQDCRDTVYIGDVNCGAVVKFKGEGNLFPARSWDNHGKGYIQNIKTEEGSALSAVCGKTVLPKGGEVTLRFEILLTPFKAVDYKSHFSVKSAVRNPALKKKIDQLELFSESAVNRVIVAEGNKENPHAGYPFNTVRELKTLVKDAHNRDLEVVAEYSPKVLPEAAPEYYAFRDTSEMILKDGKLPVPGTAGKLKTEAGAGNFYVEGNRYLLEKLNHDGVITDGGISKAALERIKKVYEDKASPVTLAVNDGALGAAELLPFADRLSVSTSSCEPDYILTELSGLVYGLTAEIMTGNVNPHLAMLFGLNSVYGNKGELGDRAALSVCELWDKFGIKDAKFFGYWDKRNPVTADKREIYVSVYIKDGDLLASVYNASEKTVRFDLGINPKLGYTSKGKKIVRPAVLGLGVRKKINFNKPFTLRGKKGMFILVSKN